MANADATRRIITSWGVIEGDWMSDTTGLFGSSKNSFHRAPLIQRGHSGHGFDFAASADANTASSNDIVNEMLW
jgi:hypothetical protein